MDINNIQRLKKFKIISTVLCALATVTILVFFIPFLIDILTTVPDPEATIDLSGLGNAIYLIFAIIGAGIALVFYIPSTILGAMGFKAVKKNGKAGDKIWFGILTFLPAFMEILLLLSILLVL